MSSRVSSKGPRGIRYNTRTCVVVVVVCCVVCAFISHKVRTCRHEEQIAAKLLDNGVSVLHLRSGRRGLNSHLPWCLCERVVDAAIDDVDAPAFEEQMRLLTELPNVRQLHLIDSGGEPHCDVVPYVSEMSSLQHLYVRGDWFSDYHMRAVAKLKHLTVLSIDSANVTDDSIDVLLRLTQLESLRLHRASVTDASMRRIAQLRNLKDLCLAHTRVTDLGVHFISELKNLEELTLSGEQFTDSSMHVLTEISTLRRIELRNTNVTDAAIRRLERQLPLADVWR
jgi:hypothetical protein